MWIYSLGITLRRTLQSFSSANNQRKATHALSRGSGGGVGDGATLLNAQNDIGNTNQRTKAPGAMMVRCQLSTAPSHHPTGNDDNRDSDSNNGAQIAPKNSSKKSSLDYVIRTMCAPNRNNRASLMYLLDVSITSLLFSFFFELHPAFPIQIANLIYSLRECYTLFRSFFLSCTCIPHINQIGVGACYDMVVCE